MQSYFEDQIVEKISLLGQAEGDQIRHAATSVEVFPSMSDLQIKADLSPLGSKLCQKMDTLTWLVRC